MNRFVVALSLVCALCGTALAQRQPQAPQMDKRWPSDPPAATQQPAQSQLPDTDEDAPPVQKPPATAPAPKKPAGPPIMIACSGVFAKESSHVKLAQIYTAQNITFGPVSGPQGSTLNATILYAKDPKRRLEVLWSNEAARSDVHLIVITGQSTWTGPKGLKLGLTLAALEKINGKPFNLNAFGGESSGSVTDWQGGALASLPGGCQVGITLKPDPKAKPDSLADVSGDKVLLSSYPGLKPANPQISEIIFGY